MSIDAAAVVAVAADLTESASAVTESADGLGGLAFGPESAGRAYGVLGGRVREGYERIGGAVRAWGSSATDLAELFDASARGYRVTDHDTAGSIARTDAGPR